jgi:hypothetical protein
MENFHPQRTNIYSKWKIFIFKGKYLSSKESINLLRKIFLTGYKYLSYKGNIFLKGKIIYPG